MSITVAFIIEGVRELILAAGEVDRDEALNHFGPVPERASSDLFVLAGEVALSGPEIINPDAPAQSLKISYYFPQEEDARAARASARQVDLSRANVIKRRLNRWRAAENHSWWFLVEERRPLLEERHFSGGFLPPFKPDDLTIYVDDLRPYGFAGFILGGLDFNRRGPSYQEASWIPSRPVSWGFLAE